MLLHLLVLAPFAAALLTALAGRSHAARLPLFFGALFTALSIGAIVTGDTATTPIDWFRLPGSEASVKYLLASFTLNTWMVFLATLLTFVALIFARSQICKKEYRQFAIGMLALLGTMNGAFLAQDAVVFFFFFEAMVIPAAVLIASYGGENRKSAAMQFAIYTLVGSAPMAIALWYMVASSGETTAAGLFTYLQTQTPAVQITLALSFLLAFLVKTPIFPFHGWQAMTYAEAPAPLSAVLTGAMSKVGVYGILVWVVTLFEAAPESLATPMLWLGLLTAVYGALMALRANDLKKLLAFSSMGHLGLACAAVFTFSPRMLPAVIVLLVGHGISAGALFFLSGVVERLTGTRDISKMGGLASVTPVFGFLFGALSIAALAVPGTVGFIGEFLALLSLWDVGPLPTVVGGFCLILSAAYMLRMVQKVLFGAPCQTVCADKTISLLEGSVAGVMLFLLVLFGFHPAFIYEMRTAETPEQVVAEQSVDSSEELSEQELNKLIDEIVAADSTAMADSIATPAEVSK